MVYLWGMLTADAIAHFGSKAKLARALNISKQSISQWGDEVPLLRQFQLKELTKGKLRMSAQYKDFPPV